MRRPAVYLHIGLPGSGAGFLETTLPEHAAGLADQGIVHPVTGADEMFRAAVEMRRDHRARGYQRREVEGTWAEVCRRVRKQRDRVLLSQELLTGCTADQSALLLDTLAGTDIHVVITARRADTERHEFADLTARWRRTLGRRHELHTLVVPSHVEPEGWYWGQLGELVGFETDRPRKDVDGSGAQPVDRPVSEAARRPRRRYAR